MIDAGREQRSNATSALERRLIAAARAGDRIAQAHLLERYEPMVRRLTRGRFLPGGDREDLAQEARLGIANAIAGWDPQRHVPFRAFAWLCATREIGMAITSARAGKHQPITAASSLQYVSASDGRTLEDTLALTGDPDSDPVAKLLARERLAEILAHARRLSALERGAITLSLNDRSRRETAHTLGVGERAVTNALQRGRRKLAA